MNNLKNLSCVTDIKQCFDQNVNCLRLSLVEENY